VPEGTILYLAMQGDNGVKDVLSIDPDGTGFTEIPDARRVEQFLLPHSSGESFLHQSNMTYFFTRNMDGSNPIQLTENVIFPDEVKYSPDGSRIAYIAYLGKTHHIYVMDADGSNLFTLTNFATHTDSEEEVEFPSDLFSFDWSPNGLHIIFEGEMNGQRDIFSIELDGSNLRNLTNTPDLNEFGPMFSPNGSLIAYSAGTSTESDLYLMSPEGTNQHRIIDLDGRSFQPVWSPDNYQIAFISNRDGDEEVYVIDPDGENFAQLTFNETREYWLDWSPDSCWLAYRSVVDDTGISEIFRTSPDGSETFQITNRKSWILRFYWVDN
jgi:TolB protein